MIAEDARWAMDVILSSQRAPAMRGYLPLILGHHLVRIAYEGAYALRLRDPNVGIPALAGLLNERFAAITARSRHATKLLDNSATDYNEVLADLERILKKHQVEFTGKAPWWLRWRENDLGMYRCRGRLVGATIPIAYRLSLDFKNGGNISGESVQEVSKEWGGTFAVLGAAALDPSKPAATIDFTRVSGIRRMDRLTSRYLRNRFETEFSVGLKILLLMIEGDLNTSRLFLPQLAKGHEFATFRAQTFTAYHSLTSLRKISDRFITLETRGSSALRALLEDAPTKRVLSREGARVRDRCVHYPILNPTITPDPSLPMYGLVESVYPGNTWERYYSDVMAVTNRVAEHLATWKPKPRSSAVR